MSEVSSLELHLPALTVPPSHSGQMPDIDQVDCRQCPVLLMPARSRLLKAGRNRSCSQAVRCTGIHMPEHYEIAVMARKLICSAISHSGARHAGRGLQLSTLISCQRLRPVIWRPQCSGVTLIHVDLCPCLRHGFTRFGQQRHVRLASRNWSGFESTRAAKDDIDSIQSDCEWHGSTTGPRPSMLARYHAWASTCPKAEHSALE